MQAGFKPTESRKLIYSLREPVGFIFMKKIKTMSKFKNIIKSLLRAFSVEVMSSSALQKLKERQKPAADFEMLIAFPNEHASQLLYFLHKSKSQLRQDLFVLSQMNFKRDGFFVEFGATNGIDLSNTYLLEKEFGWKGILAEPAICWHKDLQSNRNARIEQSCVWKDSVSTLNFNEANLAELSTIDAYSNTDLRSKARKNGKIYTVKTISFNDLLAKHNAPNDIDYLSIDTEGSEFEILNNLDFGRYSFKVITCEHNFTPMREQVFALLTKNGYVRKFEELSKFDDWYVKSS